MAKRTHSNRTSKKFKVGKELYQPSSPVGKMKSKSGKNVNLALADPLTPNWLAKPRSGAAKFLPKLGT